MYFGMNLWSVLTTSLFICTSLAYNSYADFETSHSLQRPSSHKGPLESHWNELDDNKNTYLYETDVPRDLSGRFLDLNTWPEKDSDSISRQLFGDKSDDSSEIVRSRISEVNNVDDIPKNKRESHSLSIVNPLDVLRQRLMLEMARRRMKENQDQIRENAVILKNLGKRAAPRENQESTGDQEESRPNREYLRTIHVSNSEGFDV